MKVEAGRADRVGESFGRYRVVAGLGHGGMAAVHLAVMEGPAGFNKLVVLKHVLPQFAEDAEILGMFLDEARLAARLSHPNVVQTNEVGLAGKQHFLAMEYLDGQPLNRILQRLSRHGGLPLVTHLQVIADLLAGLHHAHELADYDGSPLGVVHCDVSPHNTFITYDGVVKVVDFGVAKARTALTQTRAGVIKGKIAYMAPEQVRCEELDRRADVFAVGVMLWEAATGKRPWRGVAEPTMMESLLAGHFPAPCSANPAVPIELESIILKALSFDRRGRYETAAELQAAIDGYIESVGGRLAQRALGKLISTHFAAERAVITALIEEQLQACSCGPGPASPRVSILDVAAAAREGEARGHASSAEASVALDPMSSVRSGITRPDSVWRRRTPGALPAALVEPARRDGERSTTSKTTPPVIAAIAATAIEPRSRPVVAAAALFAVAVVATSFWPRTVESRSPPPAPAPAAAAPQPTEAAVTEVSSTVQVRLSASPEQARFFLDDAPLAGNPFLGDLPRDPGVHRLRVEAAGFVPRVASITLDRNTLVDIELAGQVAASPVRSPSPPEAGRPHPPSSTGAPRAPRILYW
jgi:serine/threonine-protein kinase